MNSDESIVILDAIPFDVDEGDALAALHLEPGAAFSDEALALLHEAISVARPKGVYRLSAVETIDDHTTALDGVRFTSRILRVNLEGVSRAFPFVATCGVELEEWSHSKADVMQRFWADGIKELALRCAITVLGNHLTGRYQPGTRAAMNPGSLADWPLSEQPRLFSLFGGAVERTGVRLSESFLMIPVKSVSGVWFETDSGFVNCQLCPREDCPNRRTPYDPHALENYA
ncbi:MAG TPA: vitamin B12 dependent-methionine synthase activation domain-containing protein [Candidatus Hydrogenedentes bacterium]|nr:vitamin B12 dependent-methionine synthase activation domain-containing protein [Candidatus Hydrogenedentota bacterium]